LIPVRVWDMVLEIVLACGGGSGGGWEGGGFLNCLKVFGIFLVVR
jgi:hypothetical protein